MKRQKEQFALTKNMKKDMDKKFNDVLKGQQDIEKDEKRTQAMMKQGFNNLMN